MKKEAVRTAWSQVVGIILLMAIPVGIAAFMMMQNSRGGANPGTLIVAMTVLLIVTVCGAIIARRSIELSADELSIRHSYYSLKIARRDVSAVEVTKLASMSELGLTLKTNGVAAFGYLSGWFRLRTGARIFCAVSAKPIYRVTLTAARLDCTTVALSCSEEMAESIRRWVV